MSLGRGFGKRKVAKNLVMDLEHAGCRARFLIRDLDGKFPWQPIQQRPKGVNIPIKRLNWATPAGDEATGVTWCGTR
ncbi:hypothetical protein V2J94_47120 [Streptomyces sp. DSM 41524]|uniref:Uncharacterized protein n=1 Tax=Streptomyces asiaticus subsp. ignotus TaxID=3098222 RepID=A0ABU7QD09_9ACTN|nr:hypothetical protein [Streptomyces sp. DSM 41524]